ncbi:MAG: hypothetical protein IJM62_04105, partial [Lachnospiraceae bacterium]|nr:hypothetical protein [Lachnospiraceae bacterium]
YYYPNHYVYKMKDVYPYDQADRVLAGINGFENHLQLLPKYYDLIQVVQKKNSDGKTESWTLYVPYNVEHMDIQIKFPGSMEEKDVRMLQATMQAVIGYYNTGFQLTPTELDKIQKAGKSLGNDAAVTSASEAVADMLSSFFKK